VIRDFVDGYAVVEDNGVSVAIGPDGGRLCEAAGDRTACVDALGRVAVSLACFLSAGFAKDSSRLLPQIFHRMLENQYR